MKKIECQVDRERNLVDLRALHKISSKYDYFLVFLLFSSFCSHGLLQKKGQETWLPQFRPELLLILYGMVRIQLEFGILGADGVDYWLLSSSILFCLFNFLPFFRLDLFVFFLHFPFFLFLLAPCNVSPFWSFLWGPDYVRQREKFSDASNCWALITRVLPLVSIRPVIRVKKCWFFYYIHCSNVPGF